MAIFLTEYKDHLGRRWCGPDISAEDLAEASRHVASLNESLAIVGVLVETIDFETGKRTIYAPPQEER
jgi:predicted heme/steroid binding protein